MSKVVLKDDKLTQEEIDTFYLVPFGYRLCVKEMKVDSYGGIYVPDDSKEMRTNEGHIIAVGASVTTCNVGDRVLYGQFSGAWIGRGNQKYRIMNEDDLLGIVKQ
jgi:co-chaperonin GroES (HSP10)